MALVNRYGEPIPPLGPRVYVEGEGRGNLISLEYVHWLGHRHVQDPGPEWAFVMFDGCGIWSKWPVGQIKKLPA